MATPDVRVRLSAEGVAEVVAALRRVQGEGQKTAAVTSGAFSRTNSVLRSTRNLVIGFGAIASARRLGSLSRDAIRANEELSALNQGFEQLESAIAGATREFFVGFGPPAIASLRALSGEVGAATSSMSVAGTVLGTTFRIVTGSILGAIDMFVAFGAAARIRTAGIALAVGGALRGNVNAARAALKVMNDEIERLDEFYRKRTIQNFFGGDAAGAVSPAEDFAARTAALEAALANELALTRARLKAREEAEQRSYEQAQFSLQTYYGQRRAIVTLGAEAEIRALLKRRELELVNPDAAKGRREVARINAEIARVEIERDARLVEERFQELQAAKKIGAERLKWQKDLLELQGRSHDARMLEIEEETRRRREQLTQAGEPAAEIERTLGVWREAAIAEANFDRAQRALQLELERIATRRTEIEADASLSEVERQQQIVAAERERLATVQELARQLIAAAELTGNAELIATARGAAAETAALGVAAKAADDSLRQLVESGVTDFLTTQIQQVRTLTDLWRNFGLTVANALQQLLGARLAKGIVDKLFPPKNGFDPLSFAAGFAGFSVGGMVRGPGTGTSDSIPARLSSGEYVVRAAAVSQPGVLGLLEDINYMRNLGEIRTSWHGYAEGGLVGADIGAIEPAAARVDGRIVVELDPGVVLKTMETPEGQRVQIQNTRKNSRAISRLLRR